MKYTYKLTYFDKGKNKEVSVTFKANSYTLARIKCGELLKGISYEDAHVTEVLVDRLEGVI